MDEIKNTDRFGRQVEMFRRVEIEEPSEPRLHRRPARLRLRTAAAFLAQFRSMYNATQTINVIIYTNRLLIDQRGDPNVNMMFKVRVMIYLHRPNLFLESKSIK